MLNPLSSRQPVSDAVATKALREFFQMVYEIDGPEELRRIYTAFYLKTHQAFPEMDLTDKSPDGNLKADSKVMAATNAH